MRRFEFEDGSSRKFWEIELSGSTFTVRWGRIGAAGQTQDKSFPSDAKAQAEHDKLIKEKTGKGYVEVDAGAAPAAAPVAAAIPVAASVVSVAAPVAAAAIPVAAPASAPVSAPASAPVSAPVSAPAEASEAPDIFWTPEMIRMIHPWRRLRYNPAPIKAEEAEKTLAKRWAVQSENLNLTEDGPEDARLAALHRAAIGRYPSKYLKVKEGAPLGDVEVESVFHAYLSRSTSYNHGQALDAHVDLCVAARGLGFAAEVLLRSLDWGFKDVVDYKAVLVEGGVSSWRGGYTGSVLVAWLRLRELLCAAPEAEWAAALETARLYLGTPTRNGAVAYLFPDSGIADDESLPKDHFAWLLSCTKVERWRAVATTGSWALHFQSRDLTYRQETMAREGAYSLLACLGVGALPGLCAMMDARSYRGADEAAGAEVCLHIHTPEAVRALAQRLHLKEVIPAAQVAVMSDPAAALPVLAQQILGRSRTSIPAETLLAQAIRRDSAPIVAALPTLSAGQAQVVQAMLQRLGPVEEAAPAELPPLLQRPPWQRARGAASAVTVLTLPRLPFTPSLEWRPEQREQWLHHIDEDDLVPAKQTEELISSRLKSMNLPEPCWRLAFSEDEAEIKRLRLRLEEELDETRWRSNWYTPFFPRPLALLLWNDVPAGKFHSYANQVEQQMIALHGLDALPGLLARVGRSPAVLEVLLPVRHPDAAMEIATAFATRRKAREEALSWMRAHPEALVIGLLPVAVGKVGKDRDAAGVTLRHLARLGHEALILEVAGRYGRPEVTAAVRAVLDTDPLDTVPTKIPKLPPFWSPAGLVRPRLRSSGHALPVAALEAVGQMLAFSTLEEPYGGIAVLKEACTPESLSDFARDLFQAWLMAGAPSKEGWAFRALGLLGDDALARWLAPQIRAWPGEAQHQRAVTGLDVLASIGSDVALMHLNGIAQKVKFKGLQEAAREKITQVAEARGLTQEELADRLVPDLGLDEQGAMILDFGPRQFSVRFDELLRPSVVTADNKPLPDLPKPVKADDADKAKEAQEAWKALKKDVKELGRQQLVRLESAMCLRRRWTPSVFRTFLVEHPLLLHLVRRLVWGQYDAEDRLVACFRVAEDGSYADAEDGPFDLPEGSEEVPVRVGVAHPLEIPAEVAAQLGQVFADYAILQPFPQLGRSTYALTEAEKGEDALTRWKDLKVATGKVLGLASRGWQRGQPQDAGVVCWMERPANIEGYDIHLHLDPGIWTGIVSEAPEQTLQSVTISQKNSWYAHTGKPFRTLDPITASEVIRALEELRG